VWSRTMGWLAWPLWVLAMALFGTGAVLWAQNQAVLPQEVSAYPFLAPGFATVGAVVLSRRTGHVVGWLFLGIGIAAGLLGFSWAYAVQAHLAGGLPAGIFMTWMQSWLVPLLILGLGLLLLVFPSGRLPTPRWRPIARVLILAYAYQLCLSMLTPTLPLQIGQGEQVFIANPVTAIKSVIVPWAVGFLAGWAGSVAAAVAPFVRFRRASVVERQQLKWLALAAAVSLTGGLLAAALFPFMPAVSWIVAMVPVLGVTVGIPVAVGIAILRYRLYEIDRLINRTLVYGLLTVLLGAVYTAGVFGLGRLLNPVTGESNLAVAASTLAVAALFQPARRRVQAVVDRRFNRRKYNAAKTVEAFSARLRDEVDLDALSAELLAVTHQTMQPTTATLWLRPSAQAGPRGQRHGS
jgi:hypothetical protein